MFLCLTSLSKFRTLLQVTSLTECVEMYLHVPIRDHRRLYKQRGPKLVVKWISVAELRVNEYRGAGKSLARPASRCILFDGENISFDISLVIYIYIYIYIVLIFLQLLL
jgi:hypothetical protein